MFGNIDEMSGKRFKNVTNMDDMLGWQKNSFDSFLKLNSDGISEYTVEQIKAKSATLGLTDSLTAQAIAFGKDADLRTRAMSGNLKWADAIADSKNSAEELATVLLSQDKIKKESFDHIMSGTTEKFRKKELQNIINGIDGLGDSFVKLESSGKKVGNSVGNVFKGMAAEAKALFVTLATNPFTYLVAGLAVAGVALKSYITEFDTAMENVKNANDEKATAYSDLNAVNQELETTKSRIDELNSKDSLTLAEEGELQKLQLQNAELERQLAIKEKLAESSMNKSAQESMDALNVKKTQDLTTTEEVTVSDKNGMLHKRSKVSQTDILTASKNELKELEAVKNERDDLLLKSNNKKLSKKEEGRLKELESLYDKYSDSLSSKLDKLQTIREGLIDPSTGMAAKGYESYERAIRQVIDGVNNIDLSPAQKSLAQIESAFSGSNTSNAIKDQLIEMSKLSEGSFSATDALHSLGITLTDLGITGEGSKDAFDNYFDGLIKSSKEAEKAAALIDMYKIWIIIHEMDKA